MSDVPAPLSAADVATSDAYRELIGTLTGRIHAAQGRAARAVNTELVLLYWSIGREILDRQQALGWGDANPRTPALRRGFCPGWS